MEVLKDIGIGLITLALFAVIAVSTYRYLDSRGMASFKPASARTTVTLDGPVEVTTKRPLAVAGKGLTAAPAPAKTQAKEWAMIGKGANGDDVVAGPFVLTNCTGPVDVTKTVPTKDADFSKGMLKQNWTVDGELFLPRGTYALLGGALCSGYRP